MILFIGPIADSGAAHLSLLMISRDAPVVPLDPRTFGTDWDLSWWYEDGRIQGEVRLGDDRIVSLDEVEAVWVHMIWLPDRHDEPAPGASTSLNQRLAGLSAFADCFPRTTICRPYTTISNTIKPFQAGIIAKFGFKPIRTLITTDPQDARRFYNEMDGQIIFKSISWRRSIVRRVTPDDLERLSTLAYCPTQFQEFIVGTDIRVHAAGDRLFATEIGCSTDDYRYVPADGERVMRGIELPEEIADNCRRMVRAMDMEIAGIDLRRSPDGEYYCFEVNPIPGFMFYEQQTGQRIGDAFVDLVAKKRSPKEPAA